MHNKKLIDKLFPPNYDFYEILIKQAELTNKGINALLKWLSDTTNQDKYYNVLKLADDADTLRIDMEKKLIQSFITPFDRQDIYTISKSIDKIFDYSKSTIESMLDYTIECDDIILSMVEELSKGTVELTHALSILKENPLKSEEFVRPMREKENSIEKLYRKGMCILFNNSDTMEALKRREVYHHIKDAGKCLGDTIDVFHKIVVRLV
ncbi:DUF47 domain-containing protein [Clostridium thailandense]|uniref:DUF47 domain-containing protein n=1 Tax=Clostridium thailandense TaxID=2794346 RepID=UPI003989BF4A